MAKTFMWVGLAAVAAVTIVSSPHGTRETSRPMRIPEVVIGADRLDPVFVSFAPPTLNGRRHVKLWATHYSIPRAIETKSEDAVALLDIKGNELGPKLSPKDFCRAAMEGTVAVSSRRRAQKLYDFDGIGEDHLTDCTKYYPRHSAIGRSRFKRARAIHGSGAGGRSMVPYRSIAVDPDLIPLGSVLFIPAARGAVVTTENGETHIHDGYFYAADTGGAIDGNHVDVFIGYSVWNPFSFVKSHANATFDAYLVEEPLVREAMLSAHAPGDNNMLSKR